MKRLILYVIVIDIKLFSLLHKKEKKKQATFFPTKIQKKPHPLNHHKLSHFTVLNLILASSAENKFSGSFRYPSCQLLPLFHRTGRHFHHYLKLCYESGFFQFIFKTRTLIQSTSKYWTR